jgi:hypothetical protein
MGSVKYVGMDVHKDTISIAVMNSAGKLIMESIIETKAITCSSPKLQPKPKTGQFLVE